MKGRKNYRFARKMCEALESRRLLSATGAFSIFATPDVPADGHGTWIAYFQDSLNDNAGLASFAIDVVGSNGLTVTSSQNDLAADIVGSVSRQTGTKNGNAIYHNFTAGSGPFTSDGTNGIDIGSSQNFAYDGLGVNNAVLDSLVYQGIGQETSAANPTATADYIASGASKVPVWGVKTDLASGTYSGGAGTLTVSVSSTFAVKYLVGAGAGTWTGPGNVASFSNIAPASVTLTGPAELLFTTPPKDVAAGSALSLVVAIDDQNINLVANDNSPVTVTLSDGVFSSGSSSATVNEVDGIATFNNLVIDSPGFHTLSASVSADRLSGFTSNYFYVSTGAPAKLVFSSVPSMVDSSGTNNQASGSYWKDGNLVRPPGAFTVTVHIEDAVGNIVTNNSSLMSLAIASGPPGASLGGYDTAYVTTGVASFDNTLAIPGLTTLQATYGSLTSAPSSPIFVNGVKQAVYRLYSPVTMEHLYTTDVHEFNVLSALNWSQEEGSIFYVYNGPAVLTAGGPVIDEPLYRLYNPFIQQHLWTVDANEYSTLATLGWNQEGIVGWVVPADNANNVPGTAALYRLSYASPAIHLWTTDQTEYNTLKSDPYGWSDEGIIAYVLS